MRNKEVGRIKVKITGDQMTSKVWGGGLVDKKGRDLPRYAC